MPAQATDGATYPEADYPSDWADDEMRLRTIENIGDPKCVYVGPTASLELSLRSNTFRTRRRGRTPG